MIKVEDWPVEKYRRISLPKDVDRELDSFVNELLQIKVYDAVRIISGAVDRWLEQCSLDDIDQWVKENLSKEKQRAYKQAKRRQRRRLFVIREYDERLMETDYSPNMARVDFAGWPGTKSRKEALELIFRIGDRLRSLPMAGAFNAALELSLRWADRYSKTLGLGSVKYFWRDSNPDSWTEQDLTGFLRWAIHVQMDTNTGTPSGLWAE